MKRVSGRAVLVAVLAMTGAGLAPATAGAGEEPRTVTVRAECPGGGTIVLRQTADADSTHVRVRSHGLGQGLRWKGTHSLEIGVDDTTDTSLGLVAVDGELKADFDLDDTGKAAVLDLRHKKRRCFASFDENRPFVIMGSATLSVLARRTEDGLLARTEIHHCQPDARWDLELGVDFEDAGVGAGIQGTCSRNGWLRERWDFGMEPTPTTRPQGLTFVVDGEGSRERLTYRATRPPVG